LTLVVDASVALAWCFDDEATPETDRLLDRVAAQGAVVPSLWRLEVANVLVMAERRRRITATELQARLDRLDRLPIRADFETAGPAMRGIVQHARAERLTAYDAAYVELALRLGGELASLDQDLRDASTRLGLTVVP